MPRLQRQRSPPPRTAPPRASPATTAHDSQTARASSNADTANVSQQRGKNRIDLVDEEDNSANNSTNLCLTIQETVRSMLKEFESRLEARFKAIDEKMSLIKIQNDVIKTTNDDIEKSILDVSARVEQVNSAIIKMEEDRMQLSNQILKINEKSEALERNLIKTCVEVRNVPKIKNESKADLYTYLKRLSNALNLSLEYAHVRDIYRLHSKRESETSSIVVELTSTYFKTNLLEACKTLYKSTSSQLTASTLGLPNNETRIFISEHLTSKGRRLFFLSKALKTDKGYSFCWTAGGNVYLRKFEGGPAILVRNEDQLTRMRKEL